MTDILDDDTLDPPGKPDFRRVGRWNSPSVIMPNGKRSTYGRFSNAGKILDDESNLTDWKLRTIIVGAAFRPELMAQVSTLSPQADKNELRDIAEECLTAGKGRERTVKGVAVHAMFDHIDLKDGWEPAPQWMGLCQSYVDKLDEWGLIPEDIEINCVHHGFRLAGRMDRRYRSTKVLVAPDNRLIPIGSRIAADTKTGAVLEYAAGSYATQLAGYAHADMYDVTTDETIPFDPPTYPDWGLVVHADSAGTEVQMYWVDLNAGLEGLKLSQQVKGWRQRSDLLTVGAGPASSPPQAPESPQDTSSSPQALPVPLDSSEPRRASLYQHTRDRVKAILEHSDIAAKALARNWPEGIPGLKTDQHTWEELQAIITSVEWVEKEYSVPWFPHWDDPELPAAIERHPSYITKPKPVTLQDIWLAYSPCHEVARAVTEFSNIDESIMDAEALTELLDGTLRAIGYDHGIPQLGSVKPEDAPAILSAVFAITSGTGMLVYRADGKPVFRSNIVKG